MVREVEEVLGSIINWSKHFYKQFHHEMVGACIHKKSILGSHIRMIFHWYKRERCKDQVDPLPSTIPPPAASRGSRPAPMKTKEQAQAHARTANGIPGGETMPTFKEPANTVMVEGIPRGSRRAPAQSVDTSGSNMEQGSSPLGAGSCP
ncbi:unnamed protein product [Calypogeia fissa]